MQLLGEPLDLHAIEKKIHTGGGGIFFISRSIDS